MKKPFFLITTILILFGGVIYLLIKWSKSQTDATTKPDDKPTVLEVVKDTLILEDVPTSAKPQPSITKEEAKSWAYNIARAIRMNKQTSINQFFSAILKLDNVSINRLIEAWENDSYRLEIGYLGLSDTILLIKCVQGIDCNMISKAANHIANATPLLSTRVRTY